MELNEKKLEDILRQQREEYQRHLSVVTEEFHSQIKLVAESAIGIQAQLSAIRDMVAKNTEDIEMIKLDLHIIKDDLKEKISRDEFKVLQRRVEILEKRSA